MKSFEPNRHVFILRIWREPREIEGAELEWRGVIEHVPTGERRYFNELNDVVDFLRPYLQQMGHKPVFYWRLRQRLKQWLNKKGKQKGIG